MSPVAEYEIDEDHRYSWILCCREHALIAQDRVDHRMRSAERELIVTEIP